MNIYQQTPHFLDINSLGAKTMIAGPVKVWHPETKGTIVRGSHKKDVSRASHAHHTQAGKLDSEFGQFENG